MSAFSIILFFASISFVVCPYTEISIAEVTQEQYFNTWKGFTLCQNKNNWGMVKQLCADLYNANLENAYSEEEIKEESPGCSIDNSEPTLSLIYLKTINGLLDFLSSVGICQMSPTFSYCVSASEKPDDLLIWSRSAVDIDGRQQLVCHPDRIRKDVFAKKGKGSGSSSKKTFFFF